MSSTAIIFDALNELLPVFARGGGGGSGGGGGGGSGGGGGGGGILLIMAIGYIPAYYVTKWFMKRANRKAAIVMGSLTVVLVTGMTAGLVGWAEAGTNDDPVLKIFIAAAISLIVGAGAIAGVHFGIIGFVSQAIDKYFDVRKILALAASKDPMWQERAIYQRTGHVFFDFQKDWSTFNLERMAQYTSPRFHEHMSLLLAAMYQMGRRNDVRAPGLIAWEVIDAVDHEVDDLDRFTVAITAKADDYLLDTDNGDQTIYRDTDTFREYWHFDRQGDEWVLDKITQSTEDSRQRVKKMEALANQHGMYYSPDMGWLLIPRRGMLFDNANFKQSDINNHVIGDWNGRLVQLYTYIPTVAKAGLNDYLVGQMTLPKSYGGIVVEKRTSRIAWLQNMRWWFHNEYQKVSLEWPDFNQRYSVHATDIDKVTSLELLNPAFMADLYDSGLNVSLEVVDDVVYFYAPVTTFAVKRYEKMLDILARAHKELER